MLYSRLVRNEMPSPGHKNRLIRAPTAEKRQSGHGFASIRARESRNRQSGSVRLVEGSGDFAEFVVEGGAIGIDEGFPQEFVDGDPFFAAFFEGAAADFPAVEVEGGQAVAEDAGADGVETA